VRRFIFEGLTIAAMASASSACAHGPQIQITGDSGKIVTRALMLDGPYSDELTGEKSVYVMPVRDFLGAWYVRPNGTIDPVLHIPEFFSGPGIAFGYGYDANNPSGADFVVGSQISLAFTAPLRRWDGAAFADPGLPQVEAFRGGFAAP
jgi:hypothetical protein